MKDKAKKAASKSALLRVRFRIDHDRDRSLLLCEAVQDCHRDGKRCPDEWIKEIGDLNKTFAK